VPQTPTPRRAVLLMGPTGSGKSELALHLAQELPLEIISVDSALVYRGMDIGTAKPDAATRARVPHHLIDIRDPTAGYSAGDFILDAQQVMQNIWARGRQPLLVGGTMLYFHALSEGIADLPAADLELRARLDPLAAQRIHANDPQRIQRALEVFHLTGKPISILQQSRVSAFADVNVREIALAPLERNDLHHRIEQRFKRMLEAGLHAEVTELFARGDLTAEHPSMRAVGYRQMWRHIAGEIAIDEASRQAIAATRQLAKRQLTWLRKRTQARWFDAMHPDAAHMILDALSEGGFTK
jgi:tRNA dimethylallyltransferase